MGNFGNNSIHQMARIDFADKTQTAPYNPLKVNAKDLNDIKASVNALYDNPSAYKGYKNLIGFLFKIPNFNSFGLDVVHNDFNDIPTIDNGNVNEEVRLLIFGLPVIVEGENTTEETFTAGKTVVFVGQTSNYKILPKEFTPRGGLTNIAQAFELVFKNNDGTDLPSPYYPNFTEKVPIEIRVYN